MIQHPIPQNISSYSFHIIGDMTFKQFLMLLIPGVLIFFTISSNLPLIIKGLIAATLLLFGLVGAFMPIEERPLDQWFIAFIKAIYRPTQFIWRRDHREPEYFTFTTASSNLQPADTPDMAALAIKRKREGLKSFLQTLPEQKLADSLEQQENQVTSNLTALFTIPASAPIPVFGNPSTAGAAPRQTAALTSLTPQTIIAPTPNETPAMPSQAPIRPAPKEVVVVPQVPISIPQTPKPAIPAPATTIFQSPSQPQPLASGGSDRPPGIPRGIPQNSVTTDSALPFPAAPTTANTIVGMVLDKTGKIIDNAIVEVRDQNHLPIRATKTNKLGQFFSTTPLKNGTYEIEVEKGGFTFPLLKLEAQGKIIPPLKIQATS
jgi:hypothetical protein